MNENLEENIDNSIPEIIKGWNWGAFFLNGIWGLGNKTYIALLGFVPIINVPVMVYLGLKGNELAWKNKQWDSVHQFKTVQKKWNIAGLAALAIYLFVVLRESWNIILG